MKKNYFTKNLNKSFITLSVIFCVLFANSAMAQKNIGWTGATNNDWYDVSNWNYPAITSVATFGNNVANINLTVANSEIAVGDKVAGYGIPAGATVTVIDATQKIITISSNTVALVGTPGTNVVFTFATPKVATSAPGVTDIALISNGASITLAAGSYYLGGLTISNETGAETGSTLTIPADVEVFVETLTNEGVLVKGGNIINNGYLDIKSSLSAGSNNQAGAYGMTFGFPAVAPSVPTEYTYSGSGTLKIDTSAGTFNSGGIYFNGFGVNGANATYKMLFNGTTNFLLSDKKNGAAGASNTHVFRAAGHGTLAPCKVILGGTGFDIGDSFSGGINGLFSGSGPGIDVTVAPETTFNVYTNANCPSSIIGFYAYGGALAPANFTNKGTINIIGATQRSSISMSAEYNAIINFKNEGTLNVDITNTLGNQACIFVAGYQAPNPNASLCTLTNTGTVSFKNKLNGASAGYAIYSYTDGIKSPFFTITNSGTMTLDGSNFNTGGRAYNPAAPTSTGSRINNSGTINTNQEFRAFYTENSSTGTISFTSTPDNTLKLMTFTVPAATAAALGATYTDANANVHTVVVNKVGGTGTTLVTHVAANAVNPFIEPVATPQVNPLSALTLASGTGDASISFTNHVGNNDNAHFQRIENSGVLNTNPGARLMTGINGFTTPAATSILSPGGNAANGLVTFSDVAGDAITILGTLKMGATGSATPGIDFDAMRFNGALDTVDISAAILDVTGIYTPAALTTIDIITTNTTEGFEGAVAGEFASVVGLPAKWTVVYPGGLGGKVQLVYDPNLGTAQFSNFKFSVYPNPTSGQLNVSAVQNISKIELFNILGQRVLSETVQATQKQLTISNLQKGVYVMEVTIDNATQSFKIVKQ